MGKTKNVLRFRRFCGHLDTKVPFDVHVNHPEVRMAPSPDPEKLSFKNLSPAYFAMVMATGIISLGAQLLGMSWIAQALFWLNLVVYLALWVLNALRVVLFPSVFFSDMVDHKKGPGFFTVVAGSCVLGAQLILIAENYLVAAFLWILGIVLWVGLNFTIFTALTIKKEKPRLDEGITGAWLLAVVSTQAISVLSSLLAPHWDQPYRLELNFFSLSMWLWGGMLYIWMISLIFYRYTFFKFSPDDLEPPYWINMGAMAISTLAGSLLIINSPDAPFLQSLLPFLKGFTVFFWATGSWWIPMLLILAFWRYVIQRFPLKYDVLYWGAIFPLGMYAVSTYQMVRSMDLWFLSEIPRYFVYLALAAWLAAFLGLAYRLGKALSGFLRRRI